jgi:membrane-bound inhibitor of C-type lysozyme
MALHPKWIGPAALTLLLGGGAAHATEALYTCSGGDHLMARFTPPGKVKGRVTLNFAGSGRSIVLPQVLSADGGRYANTRIEFWNKGRGATLTRQGRRETCSSR